MDSKNNPQILLDRIYRTVITSHKAPFTPSLFDGSLSETLFVTCFDYICNNEEASETTISGISNLFNYLQESLQNRGVFHTFYSGTYGALWLLKYIEKQTNFIEIDEETNSIFSNYCLKSAITNFKEGHFDLFIGGIGNSMYLLEAGEAENFSYIENTLYRNAIKNSKGNLVWLSQLLDGSNERGEYLGLAHGAASILVFYTSLSKLQKNHPDLEDIWDKIIKNILSHKRGNNIALFPSQVSKNSQYQNERLAWCHGDLGIAAAIFNAGVNFTNEEWLTEAYDILHHIYIKRTNLEENGIYDANICHGAAGVAHIFNKVYQYSKTPEFKAATDLWIEHTLSFAKYEDGLAGFKTYDNEKGLVNSTGLLTGISGIGLVLLSYLYPETVNTWDRCLLLS